MNCLTAVKMSLKEVADLAALGQTLFGKDSISRWEFKEGTAPRTKGPKPYRSPNDGRSQTVGRPCWRLSLCRHSGNRSGFFLMKMTC